MSASLSRPTHRSRSEGWRKSRRVQRLPSVISGARVGSSHQGGSTRNTSAPNPASMRVADGPAKTRVMSSTLRPCSGRLRLNDHSGCAIGLPDCQCNSGSFSTAWPCGCACQSCHERIVAAQPPSTKTWASSASAVQLATACAISARSLGALRFKARNAAAR